VEVERAEALLGGLLEILEDALVAGVVGDTSWKSGWAWTSSFFFSSGRLRRASVSGWITTAVSWRASTTSSR